MAEQGEEPPEGDEPRKSQLGRPLSELWASSPELQRAAQQMNMRMAELVEQQIPAGGVWWSELTERVFSQLHSSGWQTTEFLRVYAAVTRAPDLSWAVARVDTGDLRAAFRQALQQLEKENLPPAAPPVVTTGPVGEAAKSGNLGMAVVLLAVLLFTVTSTAAVAANERAVAPVMQLTVCLGFAIAVIEKYCKDD